MRFGLRSVAAGAVAILAVAVMVVSLGFDAAELWASRNPVRAVEVNADGAATLRGVTVTFTGVEEVDSLEDPYGPSFTAPQGSKLWLASFEVAVAPGSEMNWTTVSVIASDGATYTRSEQIGYGLGPTEGWLGEYAMEDGTWGSPFLLPDGVTPQRLTIVPGDEPRVYWSFDV